MRPQRWLIYTITVTGITVNSMITPVIPDILRDLDVPRSQAGWILAAATFPGIVLAPVMGILADRYGRREVLLPCLAIFGIAGVACSAAGSLGTLVALRLVQGVGSAGLINLAVVLIGDHWDGDERVRMMGRNAAMLTVSIVLLPPFGGAIGEAFGWRATFLPYVLSFATAFAVVRLPRGTRRAERLRDQLAEAKPDLLSAPMLGTLVTGVAIFVLIFGPLLTVLPIDLQDRFGLRAGVRGVIQGLPAVTATAGSLALGRLQGRFGRRRLVVAGPVFFAAGLAAIAGAPGIAVLAAGVLVFGFGEGLIIPGLQDFAAGLAPASSRGTVVAVWVGSARAGQTLGPVLASASLASTGTRETFLGAAALAVLTSVALGAGSKRR